jgi:hypothetical protein
MAGGGAGEITTYGSRFTRCTMQRLSAAGDPAKISVVCRGADGTFADTAFGLQYTN